MADTDADPALGDDAAYEIAYDEAVRALSQQQSAVDNLRTRAGVLLSAAAIATSFLGGQAIRADPNLDLCSWVAIAAFVALGICALTILWPRDEWGFTAAPSILVRDYIEAKTPRAVAGIHRDLALYMEASYDENEDKRGTLILWFRVASSLLLLETVAWVADLASLT